MKKLNLSGLESITKKTIGCKLFFIVSFFPSKLYSIECFWFLHFYFKLICFSICFCFYFFKIYNFYCFYCFYCFYISSLTILFRCFTFSLFKNKLFSKSDNFYIFSAFSVIYSLFSLILISNVSIFSFCNEICFYSLQILSVNSLKVSYYFIFNL